MRAAIETWNTFEKSRGPFCGGGGDFGKWKNGLTKKRGKNHEKELLKKQKLILLKWEEQNAPSYIYIYYFLDKIVGKYWKQTLLDDLPGAHQY